MKDLWFGQQAMAVHLLECVRIDECSGMNPSHMIAGIKLSQTKTCTGLSSARILNDQHKFDLKFIRIG